MRLIDADKIKLPQGFFEKVDNVPKFYEWLDAQPTVDAEPVRYGRWEKRLNIGELIWCSECGWMKPKDERNYRYCPNCGAKMDEVTDETD